jgi:acetyl-CoA synthetase
MFMRYGEEWPLKHDLSSLELLGSVGEPIPLKPGSVAFPIPGVDAAVVDTEGSEVPPGQAGYLIIRKPWPGMLMDIYGDPQRYRDSYWSRFPGSYYTGDFAMRDKDGYFWILGRADEVLKVAGHRIGTAELEDAAVSHPAVAEAAVASKPDPVKGEAIVLFVTLKKEASPSPNLRNEITKHLRQVIGPIATPEAIYFVDSLPKTRSGKIIRRVLKAVASGETLGDLSTLEDEASVDEVKRAYENLA